MKIKSTPFCDAFDRFYILGNIHKGRVVKHKEQPQAFFRFMNGQTTHLFVYKDGQVHIRYVPNEATQWLFDTYGS